MFFFGHDYRDKATGFPQDAFYQTPRHLHEERRAISRFFIKFLLLNIRFPTFFLYIIPQKWQNNKKFFFLKGNFFSVIFLLILIKFQINIKYLISSRFFPFLNQCIIRVTVIMFLFIMFYTLILILVSYIFHNSIQFFFVLSKAVFFPL